jgi:pimeloyl-ACP methyl ester carboxylesterase
MLAHLHQRTPVAYYDQRGWGRSNTLPGPFDLAQLAADARAVVESLGTEVVLVGHSMGGKVAQLVASEKPTALTGLVLVAPAPADPPPAVTPQYREQLAHAYDSAETVAYAVDHVLTATPLEAPVRAAIVEDSLSGAAAARTEWPLRGIAENITAAARRISVHTSVIVSSRDVVEPVDVVKSYLLPFIPGAHLYVLEGPGHLIPLEAPKQLADRLAGRSLS